MKYNSPDPLTGLRGPTSKAGEGKGMHMEAEGQEQGVGERGEGKGGNE